jgi:hypothetical protein
MQAGMHHANRHAACKSSVTAPALRVIFTEISSTVIILNETHPFQISDSHLTYKFIYKKKQSRYLLLNYVNIKNLK